MATGAAIAILLRMHLIQAIPDETDPATLKADYTELTRIYLTDIPSFTLMYRPQSFHTVNESVWTDFPHEGDGINPPVPPLDLTDGYSIAGLYNLTHSLACHALTVDVNPVGSGTISKPAENCPGGYTAGTVVPITAIPAEDSIFVNWSGDVEGTDNPISVTMNGDKAITAKFTALVLGEPSGSLVSWDESFAWTGISEATWYELEVQTAGGTQMFDLWYTKASAGCETDTSCMVIPTEAVNIVNGEYQWRVRDYGSYGYGNWTGWQSFTPPANAALGDPVGALTSWDRSLRVDGGKCGDLLLHAGADGEWGCGVRCLVHEWTGGV